MKRGGERDDQRGDAFTRVDPAHLDASPSDEELKSFWDALRPQTPSAAFQQRMATLLEQLKFKRHGERDLGATLARLREALHLTIATLRLRVHIDGGVLQDLERNAIYPENLPESFWRRYAEALHCPAEEIAQLIASYDRGKIVVTGMAAARSGPSLSREQRATFLSAPDPEIRAQLDERRAALVAALMRGP
jgi:hypothetical protein